MLKKITRYESRLNTILLLGMFLFFTVWWGVAFFVFKGQSTQNNLNWSVNYQILAIVAAYFGFFVAKQFKGVDSFPSLAIKLFSVGLVFQALGQTVYAVYITVLNINAPYASISDIFFLASSPFYFFGIKSLFTFLYKKEKLLQFSLVSLFLWVLFTALQIYFILEAGHTYTLSISNIMDLCYIVFDSAFASAALGALLVSIGFRHNRYRFAYCFIALGLLAQNFSDFYFIFSSVFHTWYVGSVGDYLYAVSYALMGLGIVQFAVSFVAVNLIVVLLNSFLFIQVLLSDSVDKFVSNGVIFITCFVLSLLLLRRNNQETLVKEKNAHIEALEESHKRLQELDKQKTEFLNLAAHQLRTPVSIVNSYVSMMQDGDYGPVPKNLKEVIDNIGESNHWLVGLADEFLNISKLESHQIKFTKAPFDMSTLIFEVAKEVEPKMHKKGLLIDLSKVEKNVVGTFDAEKIKNVVLNYVDNAVKYSTSGTITLTVKKDANGIAVTCSDQGVGFTEQDKPRFFKKFARAEYAKKIEVDSSTGLGLYICRKFVEGHGGKVWAKSAGTGKGSEFGFWIPA